MAYEFDFDQTEEPNYNTNSNKSYLSDELQKILGITNEELSSKDKHWIKCKIRQLKIQIVNK
jgi:hypothetical protein